MSPVSGVVYRIVICGFTGKYGILAQDTESQVCAMAAPFTDDKDRVDRLIAGLKRDKVSLEDFENAFLRGDLT